MFLIVKKYLNIISRFGMFSTKKLQAHIVMRKYLLLIAILFLSQVNTAIAQVITNATEQNCPGAIPVCHGDYQQNNSYSGSGTITELTTQACNPTGNSGALLSGEKNGVWYVINVVCPGYFCFTLMPNDPNDDYDWAVWDVTGGGCSLIYNYNTGVPNAYPPYGSTCNPYNQGASNYQPNLGFSGWTGLSINATQLSTNAMFNPGFFVTGGQTFALLVSNFSSTQHGYHLTFDSSTACLFDTVKPKFVSAGSKCGFVSDNIDVTMSVPVLCTSIAPNGSDFYITSAVTNAPVPGITVTGASSTNCSGLGFTTTNTFNVQFSNVLPVGTYWLHPQTGTDANTTVDLCGNEQSPIADSVQFIMADAVPPHITRIDTPACYKARLIFDRSVKCSTISGDGSDFSITGPGAVGVVKALPVSCTDGGLVSVIDIFFDGPIKVPGKYTINFVKGSNGQFISDTCGLVVVNTFSFFVSDAGVTATAYTNTNPQVNYLCYPGYFNLGAATTMLPPPPPIVNCGANGTVCSGTTTTYQAGDSTRNMSAAHTPFGGNNTQRRIRMLYKASELTALGMTSGTISQVAFNITRKNSTAPFNNFTIKMGCTADTLLDTTSGFAGTFSPALEVVYGGKNYTTSLGWNYFTLDNTYDWNATQSLLIEMCYSDSVAIGDDIVQGTPIPNQSFSDYTTSNLVQGCALSSSTGVFDANRPNTQFVFCPPPPAKYNWVWNPSDYLYNGLSDTTTAYAYNTTIYTATVVDQNYCYRRDTALLIVSQRHPYFESTSDTSVCLGNSVILQVTGGTSYIWYPAKGLSCDSCPNPTVSIDTTQIFHVGVYDQYNCGDTLQAAITINYPPLITVSPKDTLTMYNAPVQLNAYAPGARYFLWTPAAGLDNPTVPDPIAIPDSSMLYIVQVIDTNNCSSTDTVSVRIYERGVEIPSAFTPNGDGKNDVFRIANLTTQHVIEFRVFNRWGQQVYSAENNAGWNGTFNNVEQPIGTYNYVIKVTFHDGSLKTFTGAVTLIR